MSSCLNFINPQLFKFQSEYTELQGRNTIQRSDDSVLRQGPSHKLPTLLNVPSAPCVIRLHGCSVASYSKPSSKCASYTQQTAYLSVLPPALSLIVYRSSSFSQKTKILSILERRDAVSGEDGCQLVADILTR